MDQQEWQLSVASTLAELKTSQIALHTKLDAYIERSESRLDNLEHIVFRSNGQPSLVDEIRSIKRGWGAAYTVIMLILQGLIVYGADKLWAK